MGTASLIRSGSSGEYAFTSYTAGWDSPPTQSGPGYQSAIYPVSNSPKNSVQGPYEVTGPSWDQDRNSQASALAGPRSLLEIQHSLKSVLDDLGSSPSWLSDMPPTSGGGKFARPLDCECLG